MLRVTFEQFTDEGVVEYTSEFSSMRVVLSERATDTVEIQRIETRNNAIAFFRIYLTISLGFLVVEPFIIV